jgi:hypothetical protein
MAFLITYPSVILTLVLILWLTARWSLAPSDRKRTEWMLVVAALAVPADGIAQGLANSLSCLRLLKYDEFVYNFDALLGQPSFVLGRLVEHHTLLMIIVSVSYGLLPMAILGTFAAYLWGRSQAESLVVLRTFILNLLASVPLYLLFPVCGPKAAFAHFPNQAPFHLTPHLLRLAATPNGVPSVHTSSALLIFWFLRRWRWGACTGFIFLALTVLATLGSGQHYLFDLLAAVPYAVLIFQVGKLKWPWTHAMAVLDTQRLRGEPVIAENDRLQVTSPTAAGWQ